MIRAHGLQNYGNTCFLNSSLQVLMACDSVHTTSSPLSSFALPYKSGLGDPRVPQTQVMERFPEFRNNFQHDAHEWTLRMLEILEESKLTDAFDGTFHVTVAFPDCSHINRHNETFRSLSVDIPQNGKDFDAALHSIGMPEDVESCCDTCNDGKRKRAVKSMVITKWPRHLIIHWKRFGNNGRKISTRIPTPLAFKHYELVGMVNHAGRSPESGHYTACVRCPDRNWWLCNDARTASIEAKHALKASEMAYMTVWTNKFEKN
ncbi:MAG: hypothetical protein CL454_00940 [Acidimicrobiaceae bacterium]|nr:hypothetical protein [Acidimicrobiaceae bacterium]